MKTILHFRNCFFYKNEALNLPSIFDPDDDKVSMGKIQENKEEKFAKTAYLSFPHRDYDVKEFFKHKVTEFPSSFTDAEKIIIQKSKIY